MAEETPNTLVNREEAYRNFELMVGKENVNWEKLLSPAPMGIAILGQLMVIAANHTDFRLDNYKEKIKNVEDTDIKKKERFEYIKHPESFRTTLLQISNQGYSAFANAHSNMEQIRFMMQQVPTHVDEVIKILQSGNKTALSKFLPRRLQRIHETAQESFKLAEGVAKAFEELGKLISETIEATSLSKAISAEEKMNLLKKFKEEKEKRLQEEYAQLKKREKTEEENRKKAFEAANKGISLAERISSILGLPNLDANRRAEAKKLMEEASKQMEKAKAEAQQVEQEIGQITKEMLKKLENMQKMDYISASSKEAVQLLNQGLDYLNELKGHWIGLATYFNSIRNLINRNTTTSLNDFGFYAEDAKEDTTALEHMENSTKASRNYSYLTYRIADMYVNVSSRYIMDSVARLGTMITASDKIDKAQQELLDNCKVAAKGITDMVVDSREKLVRDIHQRQKKLGELMSE